MPAAQTRAPPLPAELATDSSAMEQLRGLLFGGPVDLHSLMSHEQGGGLTTRSGRISRRPHHAPGYFLRPSASAGAAARTQTESSEPPRPLNARGRPRILSDEERLKRRRQRNKVAGTWAYTEEDV